MKKNEAQGKNILHATRNIPLIDGVAAVLKKGGHVAVDMPLPDKRKGEVNISRVKPEDTGAIDGGAIIIISDVTAPVSYTHLYDFIGETRTLDMHIGTLRHKLGDESTAPRYIKTVRGVGYRFLGEVEKEG